MTLDLVGWSDELRGPVLDALGPAGHWTVEQGRALWRPRTDGVRWSRALIVLDAGKPVAAAGVVHPRLHPAHEWAYAEVAPAHRRRGIGSHLLAELRRTMPDPAGPFKAKVQAGSAGWGFAAHAGMTSIQRTRMIRVSGVPREAPSTEVVVRSTFNDAAVATWRDFYVNGHAWDPPADVEPGVWRELLTDVQQVAVVRHGDTDAGIALVLPHDGELRFAGGALRRDDPNAARVAKDLLLGISAVLGGTAFVVEVDDWMHEVDLALREFTTEVLDESRLVVQT